MDELIRACRDGDTNAFEELIEHYGTTIERFAYQIGVPYDDIPDVSQEVFIRLYRFIDEFDGRSFTSWLYKITLNIARDHSRKHISWMNKFSRLRQENKNTLPINVEEQVLENEDSQILHGYIQQLDEKYRIPIVLYYFHDFTYEAISQITNEKLSTVKVRLMRGKKLLATKIEGEIAKGGNIHG
ncbi:sigma-70 family RNA polymerase sigma factor [Ornithinibacillus sp. L9]|uniref:Sigma-70 family RNA polymerase sigma factor n=1 Tax=Ornithinibacillus caprae TaxID=2678566 RepID=A0A6N8FE51_9BACI|nr:RNA polymerase sigma factor [Ornithinibacillus caprae]MUK87952.1 sigma-70 family RNA polymerase sigma factor [Ornithinibacillus caprae]